MENELKPFDEWWWGNKERIAEGVSQYTLARVAFNSVINAAFAQSGREREADAAPREFMTHADEALWSIGEPSIKETKSGENNHVVEVNDIVDPVRDEGPVEFQGTMTLALIQNPNQ